jgi:subtilase family serine protease
MVSPQPDGTGQTIAIVDAYDDPDIFQSVDAFDNQFGLTNAGPTLFQQYGPASSFLTVVNENGQSSPLPETDPSGPGTDNWEVEEALDVEWAHAIAPGAQIILVEANSQSLSDLMTAVATAAAQPGVSVVSMSWGFAEGQAVFASDEAMYDSYFDVPSVTFVASTGDYGAADPEYPAYSPNVVAVGGTSLTLNGDGSYNSETGWGDQSPSVGAFIGSGGGLSLYEPEPTYQQGVQSTGYRTTPDVSMVADPATGAWIADPYNLDPSNPFEVVGGTSLSAPAWAGLFALVNQGRAAAGETSLNSSTPTDAQQALYMLPQTDYNSIASGNNGYTANAGYNLVTGLGTPVANLLVPDLIAYQGAGTVYSGATVGPLQDAGLVNTGASSSSTIDVFSVFDALTMGVGGVGPGYAPSAGDAVSVVSHQASTREAARLESKAIGRSFAERTTTLAGAQAEASAAVDQVLGTLQTDGGIDGSAVDDLALDLVLSPMRRTHRRASDD